MRKPIRIATVAGTAGVIALGGTAAAFAVQGSGQPTPARVSHSHPIARAGVSAEQARQIAQRLVPGARVTETELDHEHGRAVWEVDLTKSGRGYEVKIDAASGKVAGVSRTHAGERKAFSNAQPSASAPVSAERARQLAQHRVPGARVTETELDHEHGRAAWEVDLRQQHGEWEVTIDATTGQVISVHHDSDIGVDD